MLKKEKQKANMHLQYSELTELLKPLIKKATKLIFEEPSTPPINSQLKSHFGGQPYFEEGEEWPTLSSGDSLCFIFQVFNSGEMGLPETIKLIQFYYNFKASPWNSDDKGW